MGKEGSPFTLLVEGVDGMPSRPLQFSRDRPAWLLWGFRVHHEDTAGVGVEGEVKTGSGERTYKGKASYITNT